MKANDLTGFQFKFAGGGHYKVTYRTPVRGDFWVNTITDMQLIDSLLHSDWVKLKYIKTLKRLVKMGCHYNQYGELL